MEAHATKQQQEPNNDKTTSWKKIPYGLVRENTSGVTLFTLLFRGIGIHFNRPLFRFCTVDVMLVMAFHTAQGVLYSNAACVPSTSTAFYTDETGEP